VANGYAIFMPAAHQGAKSEYIAAVVLFANHAFKFINKAARALPGWWQSAETALAENAF